MLFAQSQRLAISINPASNTMPGDSATGNCTGSMRNPVVPSGIRGGMLSGQTAQCDQSIVREGTLQLYKHHLLSRHHFFIHNNNFFYT